VQVLVYSNIKKLEKDDLLFVFVVMGKFRNYGRLRRNGVVRV